MPLPHHLISMSACFGFCEQTNDIPFGRATVTCRAASTTGATFAAGVFLSFVGVMLRLGGWWVPFDHIGLLDTLGPPTASSHLREELSPTQNLGNMLAFMIAVGRCQAQVGGKDGNRKLHGWRELLIYLYRQENPQEKTREVMELI